MRWIRFLILLFIITLLDSGNVINIIATPGLHIRPDLLLIMLVFFAGNCNTTDAVLASFLIGLAADISGEVGVMGPYTVSFGIFGSLICQLRKVIIMKRIFYQALAVMLVGLLSAILANVLTMFKVGPGVSNVHWIILWTSVYSAGVAPILWMALSLMSDGLGLRQFQQARVSRR